MTIQAAASLRLFVDFFAARIFFFVSKSAPFFRADQYLCLKKKTELLIPKAVAAIDAHAFLKELFEKTEHKDKR